MKICFSNNNSGAVIDDFELDPNESVFKYTINDLSFRGEPIQLVVAQKGCGCEEETKDFTPKALIKFLKLYKDQLEKEIRNLEEKKK